MGINIKDIYKSKSDYIKADDLKGKKVPVIIESVEVVDMAREGEEPEFKTVVHFEGKDKALVLNKTNASMIASAYGDEDIDLHWVGKEIKMYPTTTNFGGEMVPCIRIDVPIAEATEEEDIPF